VRFLSVLLLFVLPVQAQNAKQGLVAETIFDMESVSSPAISSDGSQIVFGRSWVDRMKDQQRSNLWILDQKSGRLRELTSGNWRDTAPVWSPDGKRIAFLSDRDGTTQIHVMWADTREVAQLTHLEKAPSNLRWSPDGRTIAFSMNVPDDDPVLPVRLPRRPDGAQWAKPAVIVDRLTWARDGAGPVPKGFMHVFLIDAVTGGTPRQLTSGKYNHMGHEWSADGKTIYVSGIRKPDAEYLRNDSEIYAIDVATGAVKELTSRKGPDTNPTPSRDGKWIAYTGYDDQRFTSHLSSVYLMAPDGSGSKLWAGGLPSSPGRLIWAPDNRGVYYTMEERGTANVYYLPVGGQPRKLTDGNHVLSQADLAETGQFAAVRTAFHEPPSLVAFTASEPKNIRKLVDVNADVLSQRKLGEVEELWYTSKDGWKIQGWLVKPVDFDPKKKYPMVLYIHGGPWSMYNVGFNWAWQNFAANGYAVLYTNPRGSTGYGQEFVNGIQYSYPGKDYDDLMAGVDEALKKGWIDAENLFVCGGSGGGVLTAWIVGHTDRFRAAVSMRPVINWHSFVGTTDGPSWYDQFQKMPWEDPMEYAVRSPLHYAGNVKTPTMVMTGEADLRTPMSQSEEFYRALKIQKKDTLLVRMPDEFHGWRRPTHQLLQQLYLLAWFEKYRTNKPAAEKTAE
jgi:dipeptidyl aminopeptidase/acylaminoacyl peptidase